MAEVHTAHTADLDAATLTAARALLYDVFDDMTDHDWEHALGGVHALVWDGAELIGHASVIQRRLVHGGRALRAGYVEGVGVRADRRGRGHGAAMMDALERVVRGAYDLGALGATDAAAAFYAVQPTRRGTDGWHLCRLGEAGNDERVPGFPFGPGTPTPALRMARTSAGVVSPAERDCAVQRCEERLLPVRSTQRAQLGQFQL